MASPNPWMIFPFVLLLLFMAAAPALAPKFWHRHYPKISLGLGAISLGYYFLGLRAPEMVWRTAHEYVSFIMLIGSLFIVSGSIHLRVKNSATPLANAIFLLAGAILANILGTTGAAMLLIRPWIRLNENRLRAYHVAFFIFLVANVGGCLTPIGDPPLFLGYLQGVPFWWTLKNCWPAWALAVGILLGMFFIVDKIYFSRANKITGENENAGWQFSGWPNLFFLAVILAAIFLERPIFLREGIMLAAALGSYFSTRRHFRKIHEENEFNFQPILEVAILFAGIFATMMPALDLLKAHAREILGANPPPALFFWSAGGLSAVLDNAPTYLGFLNALLGASGAPDVSALLTKNSAGVLAVSLGAVFFGAATYIGNGPNFMVKAIADRQKVPTPHFMEFIWKFTLPFLLPALICVWLIFFG